MKRYLHEKIAFVQSSRPDDEHVLIVPGAKNECVPNERSRIYSIKSPLVSRATKYRALLDLRAVDEVIARERPDIIETSDPYQLGWQALRSARSRGIPVIAYYHSHFPDAYLRGPAERLGTGFARGVMNVAQNYVRNLYNHFDATLVPSRGLCEVLQDWGVTNARHAPLGVNTDTFRRAEDRKTTRDSLGIDASGVLLLYVGRLAGEKNTETLFDAFKLLPPDRFHLLTIGDGQQRDPLERLQKDSARVSWISYCADPPQLARYYRAADLLVHPGVEETFGLVPLESQACGTPVVGIRGSRMDEVILHDQSSWAAKNTPRDLADAIERMAARPDLNALGICASEKVAAGYSWPRIFEHLFSIYDEIIGG